MRPPVKSRRRCSRSRRGYARHVTTAFTAGSFDCRLIADGSGFLPAEVVFANAPASARTTALGDRLDRDGRLTLEYGFLLVQGHDAVVRRLTRASAATSIRSREDVQVVILTHSHLDHIGGLCEQGRPRFPDARHVISQVEWDWVFEDEDDDPIAHEQPAPLEEAGILELVEGPVDLVEGIRLLPAPGHTPGQLAVEIGGPTGALYLADAVTDELHVEHRDWVMKFDADPDLAVETRNELFDWAAGENLIVAAAHLPAPGRIERDGGGFRFVPLNEAS